MSSASDAATPSVQVRGGWGRSGGELIGVDSPTSHSGYSAAASVVAILLLALVAARLTEIIPVAPRFRPALLVGVVGGALVAWRTPTATLHAGLRNPLLTTFGAYALIALITAPFALWPGHAIKTVVPTFASGLLIVFVHSLCAPGLRTLDKLSRALVLAVGVLFLYVMVASLTIAGRLTAEGSLDPNDLASVSAITFPMAVMQATRGRWAARIPAVLVALLCVQVLLQSGSRGGFLAFAAATLALVLSLRGWRKSLAAIAVAIALPIVWSMAPAVFTERIRTLTNLESDYNSFDYYGRKAVWKRGIRYTMQHPLTGVGLDCYSVAEGESLRALGVKGKMSVSHNAYVQAFAELGLFGGSIFLLLLGRAAATFVRLARRRDGWDTPRPEFIASLAGFAVGAYFLSHAYFWAFFGLLGIAALGWRITSQPGPGLAAATSSTLRATHGWRSRPR